MEGRSRKRAAIKFSFWSAASVALFALVIRSYVSGQMASWYYHTAATDGYAVNAKAFMNASKDNPAVLEIGSFDRVDGLQAVQVKKGDRLPANANGLITEDVLAAGKRATLEGNQIKVAIPWEIKESKGFKFKDTFRHKGIRTNPWAAVWNVVVVISLGMALGYMAEGLTDLLGMKLTKIRHFEGH